MAEYSCCSSVAFERPNEYALTYARSHVVFRFPFSPAPDHPLLCALPVVNGPPPCGCSHHAFSSFSGATDDCQTRSVPSAFGFLGGATVSTTIPPMSTALLGPLVFKPAVRAHACVCVFLCVFVSVYVCVCARQMPRMADDMGC
jgi:hypothetical protein